MIIPTTYIAVLLLSIVSMICLGSWANTFKAAGPKWRFELYYFDFAFGLLLTSVIAATTLGNFGTELSFADNMVVTGKRQIGYGVVAGFVFNLANMLFLAGISVAGMAATFPLSFSATIIVASLIRYLMGGKESILLIAGGNAVLVGGIIAMALAYEAYLKQQNPGKKKLPVGKGVALGVISGVLMAFPTFFLDLSRTGDIGLGAYSILFTVAIGIFLSTPVLNIYFMNLPVHGEALTLGRYFKGTLKLHLLGILGGALWAIAQLSAFLAAVPGGNAKSISLDPAVAIGLTGGVILLGLLWGVLVWREFQPASSKVRSLITVSLACAVFGTALIAISPMLAK